MKTKQLGLFVLALALAVALVGCSGGGSPAAAVAGSVEIYSPWVRPAVQGDSTAAYMLLKNTSSQVDQLVKAEFNKAGMVELMNTSMQGDVMSMVTIPEIEVPANGEVELAPGGYHVMLMMLKEDVNEGSMATVTLTFASGASVTVDMQVKMQP
jgi:periplasmic copper chaperone A